MDIILGTIVCEMENNNGNWMRIPLLESPIQSLISILHIIPNSNIDFLGLDCIHLIVPSYKNFNSLSATRSKMNSSETTHVTVHTYDKVTSYELC